MRIEVYQQHGKRHEKERGSAGNACGCAGEPGSTYPVDVECLPPVGSGVWVKGKGAWRELTIERYTFGDPQRSDRILAWASYDAEE